MWNPFIPKSYRNRHIVLSTLVSFRIEIENTNPNAPGIEMCLTKNQLSEKTALPMDVINEQLDYLYHTKDVEVTFHEKEKVNKYIAMAKGMQTNAARTFLNDGVLLNSQIYNNYLNSIFQGVVAIIAIVAIIQSFTTISDLKEANKQMTVEVSHITTELRELRLSVETQKNAAGTKVESQTKTQTDSPPSKKP